MNLIIRTIQSLALLGLAGCAGVDHQSVTLKPKILLPAQPGDANIYKEIFARNAQITEENNIRESKLKGLRYYRPAPYLLVYSDGKESLKWEIHVLPEPTVKSSAYPYNYVASLQVTLQFNEKGILTSVDETADTAAVPKAVIGSIEKLAATVAKAVMDAPAEQRVNYFPAPRLYKIVVNGDGVEFLGGETIESALMSAPKAPEK